MKLAIIGSGRMAWIIGRNARDMGIETYCFSNVQTYYITENIDHFINISIFEKEFIVAFCKTHSINGVIASTELTIAIAAYVAEQIGSPGIPYNIATLITDKYRNRKVCAGIKELTQPKFHLIQNDKEINATQYKYPVIVKPTSKGGKKGVTVVYKASELMQAYLFANRESNNAPIIIEEYIAGGQEYSVESISVQGKHTIIQVTEKISSGPPHCVELGHHQPASISNEVLTRIENAISKGLTAIGLDNSTCHTEIKIFENNIYLIEFNARPGGDHIAWPLTELSTGFPYIKAAIKVALGISTTIDTTSLEHNYAGVYFVTKQTSCLKEIFDNCENYSWLYKRNYKSDELQQLEHNDCYETNSIMYFSTDKRPDLLKICGGNISLNDNID